MRLGMIIMMIIMMMIIASILYKHRNCVRSCTCPSMTLYAVLVHEYFM